MKLFLLTRKAWDYDEHGSALIRANSEDEARQIATDAKLCGPLGAWKDLGTTCDVITEDGETGIILDVFHAG